MGKIILYFSLFVSYLQNGKLSDYNNKAELLCYLVVVPNSMIFLVR